MKVAAPTESVAVTVNVSVPAAVGAPLTARLVVPLLGTLRPGMAFWMLLTARVRAARAVGGCNGLVIADIDRVRRQRRQGERDGWIDRDRVIGEGRAADRIGGGDGERFRACRRGRAADGQVVRAAAWDGQAGDRVLDIADRQGDGARAAAGGDGLVIGEINCVRRQRRRAECHGRIDRDRVIGDGRAADRIRGGDGECLCARRRGRAADGQTGRATARDDQAGDGVLDVADRQCDGARAAARSDRLVVGEVNSVRRQRRRLSVTAGSTVIE